VRRVGSETTDAVVNVRFIAATNTNPEEAMQSAGCARTCTTACAWCDSRPSCASGPRTFRSSPSASSRTTDPPPRPGHPLPRLSKGAVGARGAPVARERARAAERDRARGRAARARRRVRPRTFPLESGRPIRRSWPTTRRRATTRLLRRARPPAGPLRPPLLTRVVMRAGGNLSKAARLAQVDRTTFYRLMERHGLQRDLLTGARSSGGAHTRP